MSETTATRSELGDEDGRLSIGALMRANRRLQDELQLEKGRSLELSQVVSRLLRERGEADTATDRRRQELQEAVAHGPRPSTAPAEARPRRTTTTATIKLFEAYYAGSPFATDAHQRRQSVYEARQGRLPRSVLCIFADLRWFACATNRPRSSAGGSAVTCRRRTIFTSQIEETGGSLCGVG
jgi:hypothetical protein